MVEVSDRGRGVQPVQRDLLEAPQLRALGVVADREQHGDPVVPDPAETAVSNFFNNLGEIRNGVNSALQLRGDAFGTAALIACGRHPEVTTPGHAACRKN